MVIGNKEACQFYFQRVAENTFKCKACPNKKKPFTQNEAKGFSNLMAHLNGSHSTWEEEMEKRESSTDGTLLHLVNKKGIYFACFQYYTSCLQFKS
jgi:hypothetical protein